MEVTNTDIPSVFEGMYAHTRTQNLAGKSVDTLAIWLMTPLYTPQTKQDRAYNTSHVATRAIVERTIGRLKGRWLCLDTAGGKLVYKPEKVL